MGKLMDYKLLQKGFGFTRALADEFMQSCKSKDVPIAAIHRLVTPKGRGTMDALAERILVDWQLEQPESSDQACGIVSFSAMVAYVQPEFEELKRRFPAYITPDLQDNHFYPIERCKDVSMENREIVFEYLCMDCQVSTDEVLVEMDKFGLRPALYEELLSFAEKYPDEQRKFPIIALGSEVHVLGDRRFPYLWDVIDGRTLRLGWIVGGRNVDYQYLAVRR